MLHLYTVHTQDSMPDDCFSFRPSSPRLHVDHSTCVHPVVGFQLVLEAEFLPAAVTFVGLLAGVDALVALQRVLISETAPAELALVRVVAGCKGGTNRRT